MHSEPVYFPKIRVRRDGNEQSPWTFTGKTMGLFLLVIVLGGLIGSFHLNQASYVATAGLEIVGLTKERERLRQDNAELRRRIAEMETLHNVGRRAEELGFIETESVEYLIIDKLPLETVEQAASAHTQVEDVDQDEPRSISSELARWSEELTDQFESWTKIQP